MSELDADYFGKLADAMGLLASEGALPPRFRFRSHGVELPRDGLAQDALRACGAIASEDRGRDWRPSVRPDLTMNVESVEDPVIASRDGEEILRSIAGGTGTVGDLVMLYSHATTQIGTAACYGTDGELPPAERLELERMRGLCGVALLSLRETFGPRMVAPDRLPAIGDEVLSLCNPSSSGKVAVIHHDNDIGPEIYADRADGGPPGLDCFEGTIILKGRGLPRLVPILPEERAAPSMGR